MTPCRRVAATASLIGAVWGCGTSAEPNAQVTAMVPNAAFNDAAFGALIAGDSFRPAYGFDTMAAAAHTDVGAFAAVLTPTAGGAPIALDAVSWQSPKALAATVPAGIPAGTYDVIVTDPRSSQFKLSSGFRSLGADLVAPVVTIESPATDTLVGEGTTVTVTLSADDDEGLLQALSANVTPATVRGPVTCAVPADSHDTRCSFDLVVPAPTDDLSSISITAAATDSVGNASETPTTTLRLAPRPTLLSASRDTGPATGGTEIVVEGTGFIENATEMLIDGHPVPTLWLSATTLQGTTAPHDAGQYSMTVATAGAESAQSFPFTFIGAPIIRLVCPLHGPVNGGTRVTILGNNFRDGQTKISFGSNFVDIKTIAPNRIDGLVPAAAAPGQVSILATDPVGGHGGYADLFTYDTFTTADGPDAGADPTICNGVP